MFRGTCASIEMLKGYMARESLGTPALKTHTTTWFPIKLCVKKLALGAQGLIILSRYA